VILHINAINKYNGFENAMLNVENKLLDLVKEATTTSILNSYDKLINLKYLYSPDFQSTRIAFKQVLQDKQYIAITGSLQNMKRKDFEKYIEQYGYELSSNLKKCKFLVNNDINSTSTKNKQAKEFGVKIITEAECYELLSK
jgi:NAD-dependent DNA ligase